MQHWLNVGSVLQPCCWLLYWTLTWAPSGAAFKCNILASHHLLLPGVYIFSYRGSTLPRSFLPLQKYPNKGFLELLHSNIISYQNSTSSSYQGCIFPVILCSNIKIGVQSWQYWTAALKCNILPSQHHLLLLHCSTLSRMDWCTHHQSWKTHALAQISRFIRFMHNPFVLS